MARRRTRCEASRSSTPRCSIPTRHAYTSVCRLSARPRRPGSASSPGRRFFFVVNDIIAKDNRIPPKGFKNAAFAERHCQPVGAKYADGQHWDDVELQLPEGTTRVEVRLMYQSVSAEYVKFFVEENKTDDWGRRVYDVWARTGHCPPEVIAEVTGAAGGR